MMRRPFIVLRSRPWLDRLEAVEIIPKHEIMSGQRPFGNAPDDVGAWRGVVLLSVARNC